MQLRATALALVVLAGTSDADDIDSETFRTTPGLAGDGFHVESADVGRTGEWMAAVIASFASNPLAVDTSVGGSAVAADRPVTRRGMLELAGAYAFGQRFEAGVRVPLFAQRGDSPDGSTFHVPAADGFAFGDVGLNARARLIATDRISAGGGVQLTLPTSTAGQFVGVDGPTARVLALATIRAMPAVELTANAGGILRATSTYRNDTMVPQGAIQISQGSGFAWGAGASARVTARLRVTAEVFGEIVSAGELVDPSMPVDALAGARYQLDSGLQLGVAVGRGLTDALGAPELRGVVALAFAPGRTVARVEPDEPEEEWKPPSPGPATPTAIAAGTTDRCPAEAEDMDGFQDEDGCADPDNDRDLIVDAKDRCPNQAEVINGVDDNDGCPDVGDDHVTTAAANQSPVQAAEEAFKQGRTLMKEKKFARACAAFETSQRLDPQFGTQFNLADCYVEIGKLAMAWTMYRELSRSDKNPDRRKEAAATATKLAKRVPKLRLTLPAPAPKGVSVFLNGANANLWLGVETPLDFGSYEITAGAPGFSPWRKTIQVDADGQVFAIPIKLEAAP